MNGEYGFNEKKGTTVKKNKLLPAEWTFAICKLLAAIAIILATAAPASSGTKPPNIVFILADDLGWRDLSGEGSTFYATFSIAEGGP